MLNNTYRIARCGVARRNTVGAWVGAGLLFLAGVLAPPLAAGEIRGKVADVSEGAAVVIIDSAAVVKPGDRVEIFEVLPDIHEEASVATGRVSVTNGSALLVNFDRTTGTVIPGQFARVMTPDATPAYTSASGASPARIPNGLPALNLPLAGARPAPTPAQYGWQQLRRRVPSDINSYAGAARMVPASYPSGPMVVFRAIPSSGGGARSSSSARSLTARELQRALAILRRILEQEARRRMQQNQRPPMVRQRPLAKQMTSAYSPMAPMNGPGTFADVAPTFDPTAVDYGTGINLQSIIDDFGGPHDPPQEGDGMEMHHQQPPDDQSGMDDQPQDGDGMSMQHDAQGGDNGAGDDPGQGGDDSGGGDDPGQGGDTDGL